jgi:hypothetical protein
MRSIRFSEGNCYNIVNHSAVDEHRLEDFTATKERSVAKSAKFKSIEETLTNAGNRQSDLQLQRRMNRVSYNRWQPEVERGYHIIRNDLSVNTTGLKKPEKVWDKITVSSEQQQQQQLQSRHTQSSPALLQASTSSWSSGANTPAGGAGRSIPSLDLTRAGPAQPVKYSEPAGGAAGQLVPIVPVSLSSTSSSSVRTGGFSNLH